ncbi:2Fe-2S iron-sulfur cluster-binding protein, partial [Xanthomonas vasicola]|uniref:2Fe-2S iron-sulfur cluster-binding protein n=1 Tax=Xanthomonas vasicola TaxID=56459 RepID=UPI0005787302
MSATVRLHVDAQLVAVPAGASVAAAVAQATLRFRESSGGQPRAPLCGMGVST